MAWFCSSFSIIITYSLQYKTIYKKVTDTQVNLSLKMNFFLKIHILRSIYCHFFLCGNFYLNTFPYNLHAIQVFRQFSSRLTHFLILFTCFSNILDHLPCSRLLTHFSLCLGSCLFMQLFLPFPLSVDVNFVLTCNTFLLWTFTSDGGVSSTG